MSEPQFKTYDELLAEYYRQKTEIAELKDRIDELSSKESSQRTIIEKAIAWIKHPLTGFSEMDVDTIELLRILEGQGTLSDESVHGKPKPEVKE